MQGMELCRRFFHECCRPMLEKALGEDMERIACGRLGWGSDCLGLDDELSRDHGWGAGFDVYLLPEDVGTRLEVQIREVVESMAKKFQGFPVEQEPDRIESLDGAFKLRVGRETPPERPIDWRSLALLTLYGAGIEIAQHAVPNRAMSAADLVADIVGLLLYALLVGPWLRRRLLRPKP